MTKRLIGILSRGGGVRRHGKWMSAALASTVLTFPVTVSPVMAQSTAETDNTAIIVTAQRRTEALQDVPMTVNVLTAETLESSGVNSVRDLSSVTTGFQLAQGGSVPQPAIRGVTTLINGSYENNVATYIDGVYQTVAAAINIDLPNVSNVQVLKGPQGTLYGRNATGGAILIETMAPTDNWEGRGELTYGRFDDKRARANISGPLTNSIGISLAGYLRKTDGYMKKLSRTEGNGVTEGRTFGLKQEAIRAKLAANVTDRIHATIGYNYTRSKDPRGVDFTPHENAAGSYALPGGSYNGDRILPTKLGQVAYDFDPTVDVMVHEGFLKLQFQTSIGEIQSITAYQSAKTRTNYDFDGSYLPAYYSTSRQRDQTWQQTIDYHIDAIDRLDLIVGAQYFHIKNSFPGPQTANYGYVFQGNLGYQYNGVEIPLSTYVVADSFIFNRKKDAFAAYFDATYELVDGLSVNLGGRYSVEEQRVKATKWGGPAGMGPILYSPATGASKRSNYAKFTPRASIRYAFSPEVSVYGTYSQGFKSGEWNIVIPSNNPDLWFDVGQEKIDAFEVGLKSSLRNFRFDIAGFHYNYKDLQVATTTFVPSFGTLVLLQNAPKAKIYGAEANFEWEPVHNAHLRGGATWLHARYGNGFTFSGVSVNSAAVGTSVNSDPLKTYLNVTETQDLSGKQMSRSPNFSAYVGADYLFEIDKGGVLLAASMKYTDSYVVTNPSVWGSGVIGTPYEDRAGEQRFRQKGYALINTSITFTDPSDTFYIRAWGNNITNRKYRLHYSGTSTFGTYSPMAEPRTYGVTVGAKFK